MATRVNHKFLMLLVKVGMKKSLIAVFLMTAAFAVSPLAVSQIQTAKVTGGEVKGVVADGIATFKGIPFAAPPVGDLRCAFMKDSAIGEKHNCEPIKPDCLPYQWTVTSSPRASGSSFNVRIVSSEGGSASRTTLPS